MIHNLDIRLRNLAPLLLFLAVVLATAGSGAEELPNLTDKERAWLTQNHPVRVKVSDFAPHIFLDGVEPKGISVDYLKRIAEQTGINFVFLEKQRGYWDAVASMRRGEGPDLIMAMDRDPERAKGISFSQTYMVAPHVIITRRESEFVAGIQDLNGKTLAAIPGGRSERLAQEYPDIVLAARFSSNREALEAVSKGQVDAYMGDLLVATYFIETFGYSNLQVAAPGPLGDRRLCFGNRPDWPELTSIIDKVLDGIPQAERSAIQGKYLSVRYQYGLHTGDVVKWVMIVAGAGLLMILLFVNWNRQLQRTVEKQTIEVAKGVTQLGKSKAQLEEAQRISRTGSWEWDIGTDKFIWSKGFYNIVGRDQAKPALSFAEHPQLFTSESFERLSLAVGDAVNNGSSYALELDLIREDGELRSISAVGEPTRGTAGTVTGLRGTVQDITERKRAEGAIAVNERLFRATFEQAAVGIAHVSPEGRFLRINQKFCEILGYTHDEMQQRAFQDITHADDLDADVEHVERLLRGDANTYSMEKRYLCKDSSLIWVGLTVSLVRNEAGEPDYFVSVIQDITDRKQTEEALRASERILKVAQKTAHLGLYSGDLITKKGAWSDEQYHIYGYSPGEIEPSFETAHNHVHPEDREKWLKGNQDHLQEKIPYQLEYRIIRKDGAVRTILSWASMEMNDAGVPTRTVGLTQDITERKQAELQLREYQQRLKDLASQLTVTEERERQRIATDLHDHVCQTLALMRLQLATLRKRVTDPNVAAPLDDFSASLLQANRDTRHLMFELSSPTLNEWGLAAAIAEWLEEELQQRHGLETEFQNTGLTQPLDQDLRAVLFRNVRELLTNIVKHAQAQRVVVTLQQSGTSVSLVVTDDGVGFDPNQATAGEREHPGFGLFSVQERMADMGGSMEVVSAPGEGCTVTLTLPVTA